jgi:hypothetical protein
MIIMVVVVVVYAGKKTRRGQAGKKEKRVGGMGSGIRGNQGFGEWRIGAC